jgi:hypothetical protein
MPIRQIAVWSKQLSFEIFYPAGESRIEAIDNEGGN